MKDRLYDALALGLLWGCVYLLVKPARVPVRKRQN